MAQYTRLRPLDDIPGIRLRLADETDPVWQATEHALGMPEAPIPFWAFAWAGGIALARYVFERPDEVAGRQVLDLAAGSGLCAIAALQAGASNATAADIDPFAGTAVALNARANGVHVDFIGRDLLDERPPHVDVILAGDTWYEAPLAARVAPWLAWAAQRGTRVLVGDPGRRYLPATGIVQLAEYAVHTTTALEDSEMVTARVYAIDPHGQG